MTAPVTPDGRYIVVRGTLWRATNPNLMDQDKEALVKALMDARRRVRSSDTEAVAQARADVHEAKMALGERGPVWWDDGAPDYTRHMAVNTPYRNWFESQKSN